MSRFLKPASNGYDIPFLITGSLAEANIRQCIRAYQEKAHSETKMRVDKSNKVYVSYGKIIQRKCNVLFKPGKHS